MPCLTKLSAHRHTNMDSDGGLVVLVELWLGQASVGGGEGRLDLLRPQQHRLGSDSAHGTVCGCSSGGGGGGDQVEGGNTHPLHTHFYYTTYYYVLHSHSVCSHILRQPPSSSVGTTTTPTGAGLPSPSSSSSLQPRPPQPQPSREMQTHSLRKEGSSSFTQVATTART